MTLESFRKLAGVGALEEAITKFLEHTRCAKHNTGIAGGRGNFGWLLGQQNHHDTCAEAIAKSAEPQKPRIFVIAKKRVPRTELLVAMLKPPRISHAVLSCGQNAKSRGCGEVGMTWGRRCTQGPRYRRSMKYHHVTRCWSWPFLLTKANAMSVFFFPSFLLCYHCSALTVAKRPCTIDLMIRIIGSPLRMFDIVAPRSVFGV